MAQEDQVAEALRRRLYEPSASQADLAAYLDRAGPEPEAELPVPAPERRPSRGFLRIGVAVAGSVLVLAAGAAAIGVSASHPASQATPTPSSSAAAAWAAAPRDPGDGVGVPSVVDGGARTHAAGTVSVASDTAYGYTTARGDTASGIAQRFGLCDADVLAALPSGMDPTGIPAGRQLLLRRDAASGAC
jgi:hypothetical protein